MFPRPRNNGRLTVIMWAVLTGQPFGTPVMYGQVAIHYLQKKSAIQPMIEFPEDQVSNRSAFSTNKSLGRTDLVQSKTGRMRAKHT